MALRTQILEAQHRLARASAAPPWAVFIVKNNDDQEAREQEHRRRVAVAALSSERRNRRLDEASNRSDPIYTTDAAVNTRHLVTAWRRRRSVKRTRPRLARHRPLECSRQKDSTGLEGRRAPGPSSATVDHLLIAKRDSAGSNSRRRPAPAEAKLICRTDRLIP